MKNISALELETVCGYIFIRLIRMLFFLDFIHDFYYLRNNNLKEDKDNIEKLFKKYKEIYEKDIKYIQNILKLKFNFSDYIDVLNLINLDDNKKYSLIDLDNKIQSCNDKIAKDISKKIINFLKINEKNDEISECNMFNKIIENIKLYNIKTSNDINIFIDSEYANVNMCPLINTLRFIVINESDSKITLSESIANDYDSANTGSLKKIFNNLIKNEDKRNKKNKNLKYEKFDKNNINIFFNYGSITLVNIHFTPTKYDDNKNLTNNDDKVKNKNNNINLIVKTFFSINNYENYYCEHSNQSRIKEKLIKENDSEKFLLTSLCKTMGDFSQILLVYHLSEINTDKIYLLFTFDIIASYISSIFNYGTIRENSNNYLVPLSYFLTNDYLTLSTKNYLSIMKNLKDKYNYEKLRYIENYDLYKNINKKKQKDNSHNRLKIVNKLRGIQKLSNNYGKYNKKNNNYKIKNNKKKDTKLLQKYAKKIGLPIKNNKNKLKSYKKLKNEINTLIKLSKKYSIVINKKLYSNLKKLYELQTIARKNKVKITKKINGKYKYKTIKN